MGFLSVLGMAQRLVKERVTPGSAVIDATCGNGVDTQFLAELVGPRGTVYAFDIQAAALERTRQRLGLAAAAGLGGADGPGGKHGPAGKPSGSFPPGAQGGALLGGAAGSFPPDANGEALLGRAAGSALPGAQGGALLGGAASSFPPDAQGGALLGGAAGSFPPGANGEALRLVHASHAEMERHVAVKHRGAVAAIMFNLGYLPGADTTVITAPDSTLPALEAALSLLRPGGIITAVLYPGHPGGLEEAEAVAAWACSIPQPSCQTVLYRMVQKAEAPYLIAVEKK